MDRVTRIAALLGVLAFASPAFADDVLKIAAGQRGSWETGISDLGQRAGIFKRHGLELQIVYTQGSGETQQAVISGSVDIGIAVGSLGALGAFSKGAPVRAVGATMTGAGTRSAAALGRIAAPAGGVPHGVGEPTQSVTRLRSVGSRDGRGPPVC